MYYKGYRIESNRLKGWDYGSEADYFITICTKNAVNYFAEIQNGTLIKLPLWYVTKRYWQEICVHFPFVTVLDFVVMPNHVHGILRVNERNEETHHDVSLLVVNKFGPQKNNIPSIIRHFKGAVKRYANKNDIQFHWQSNYHEQILWTDWHFYNVRRYIRSNVESWKEEEK